MSADSLISRLSLLTEPSREIDAEIALANGWTKHESLATGERYWRGPEGCVRGVGSPPRYTESLDAALTLIPSDPANPGKPMLWWLNYDEDGVAGPRGYTASLGKGYHDPDYVYGHSDVNPAIALLIAIMKAKEESKP